MVIFCQFLHGTCLDGIGCELFCRVNCVIIVGGWASLVDCSLDSFGLVSDGDHPEASYSAFFTTYNFSASVCDVTSNHCEFYCATSIAEFGD